MHNLNESTIEWNNEQAWIKFANYGQFGELQKRPNITIVRTNETITELVDSSENIRLIDITFLILVVFTIVFVFVTLTIKVLCQRLSDKDIDIELEYLQTLSRNIAPSRPVPVIPARKPLKQPIIKSLPKYVSQSVSLPSQKTGPMSVPVQSSSFTSYSTGTQPTDQDKSSSDLRLKIATLKGKISLPSKQSVISPVNESDHLSVSKFRTEAISLYSKSFPEDHLTSKQSIDYHSKYPASNSSFDHQSGEVRKLSLGLSREDLISVMSDRDSFEMDINAQKFRSEKRKVTSGFDQNSKQNVYNSKITYSSLKDDLGKSSYQIDESTAFSVNKPSHTLRKAHRDSYSIDSRVSKSSKSPKSHRKAPPQALSSSKPRSKLVSLKTHKPELPTRGSYKSTKHKSPKRAN